MTRAVSTRRRARARRGPSTGSRWVLVVPTASEAPVWVPSRSGLGSIPSCTMHLPTASSLVQPRRPRRRLVRLRLRELAVSRGHAAIVQLVALAAIAGGCGASTSDSPAGASEPQGVPEQAVPPPPEAHTASEAGASISSEPEYPQWVVRIERRQMRGRRAPARVTLVAELTHRAGRVELSLGPAHPGHDAEGRQTTTLHGDVRGEVLSTAAAIDWSALQRLAERAEVEWDPSSTVFDLEAEVGGERVFAFVTPNEVPLRRESWARGARTYPLARLVLLAGSGGIESSKKEPLRAYRRACERGDGAACHRAAYCYREGLGVQASVEQARSFYRRGCLAEPIFPPACDALEAVADGETARDELRQRCLGSRGARPCTAYAEAILETDPAGARHILRARCRNGGEAACRKLGLLLRDGAGLPKHEEAAAHWLGLACNLDERSEACIELGVLLRERDPAAAIARLAPSCRSGVDEACDALEGIPDGGREQALGIYRAHCDERRRYCVRFGRLADEVGADTADVVDDLARDCEERARARACVRLGELYRHGDGRDKGLGRARRLYRLACETSGVHGCNRLARLYEEGEGVPRDYQEAAEYFERSCDGGTNTGCAHLASLYYLGKIEQDRARAAELWTIACERLHHPSCTRAGFLYDRGRGVEEDDRKAAELYDRGCPVDADSCAFLGHLYHRGHGVERDPARARALYEQGCQRDSANACYLLGRLYESGVGVDVDTARARRLYEKACARGLEDACTDD